MYAFVYALKLIWNSAIKLLFSFSLHFLFNRWNDVHRSQFNNISLNDLLSHKIVFSFIFVSTPFIYFIINIWKIKLE